MLLPCMCHAKMDPRPSGGQAGRGAEPKAQKAWRAGVWNIAREETERVSVLREWTGVGGVQPLPCPAVTELIFFQMRDILKDPSET